MQKTLLIGYLGKDPEMKYTPGGTAIATFTIASTERWKNSAGEPQEHTEWFNIKVFGKRAEVVAERLHKGSRIFLEGRQRTELFQSSTDLRIRSRWVWSVMSYFAHGGLPD